MRKRELDNEQLKRGQQATKNKQLVTAKQTHYEASTDYYRSRNKRNSQRILEKRTAHDSRTGKSQQVVKRVTRSISTQNNEVHSRKAAKLVASGEARVRPRAFAATHGVDPDRKYAACPFSSPESASSSQVSRRLRPRRSGSADLRAPWRGESFAFSKPCEDDRKPSSTYSCFFLAALRTEAA